MVAERSRSGRSIYFRTKGLIPIKKEAENLNLYQKMAKIRKQVEVLKKDKKAFGYNYTAEETILAKISVFMEKYAISLIPAIVPGTTEVEPYFAKKTKTTKDGEIYEENINEVVVSADMVFTWINDENPEEKIVVPWALAGQQTDASQALGSGLTYCTRYFLLKYFNIATSDDPDAVRSKQKNAAAEEEKMLLESLINEIDKNIKAYLSVNVEAKDSVKKLVTKYVKSGDYFSIKDSVMAAKLLGDFNAEFLKIKE